MQSGIIQRAKIRRCFIQNKQAELQKNMELGRNLWAVTRPDPIQTLMTCWPESRPRKNGSTFNPLTPTVAIGYVQL